MYTDVHVFIIPCSSSPERGSLGLRLFTSNQAQSLRRDMKSALSKMVTELQQEIDEINRQANNSEELDKDEMWLIEFLPNCYKYGENTTYYIYYICTMYMYIYLYS